MKRHPALIPLSHDHHAELVQARRLRLASGSDVAEARMAAAEQYVAAFSTETESHLRIEEERLFPLFVRHAGSSPLLEQVLGEHDELRDLAVGLRDEAATGDVSGETMVQVADLLDAHVRREERELFPLIEQTVPDAELSALDLPSSVTPASKTSRTLRFPSQAIVEVTFPATSRAAVRQKPCERERAVSAD